MAKPVVDRLERELEGEVEVLRLSSLSSIGRELGARYGIRGVPTFLLFDREGAVVHYQVGKLDADLIGSEIASMRR